ncbi:MAG: hypothetical protein ABI601_05655 [bacterium]
MPGIELFGIAAVTVMVVTYALEDRATGFVLAFALSCAAAATYATLIKAWPFAAVESIWTLIALRRWLRRRAIENAA